MNEYVTVPNVTMLMIVFLNVWQVGKSVLRIIKDRTATTYDDTALAWMESIEAKANAAQEGEWVKAYAPSFWVQVEALSQSQGLKGVSKLAMYLKLAHDAYVAAKGKTLSAESVKSLELLAGGLSASAKLPAIANPTQAAQVSR